MENMRHQMQTVAVFASLLKMTLRWFIVAIVTAATPYARTVVR